jgi:hypothetical protein
MFIQLQRIDGEQKNTVIRDFTRNGNKSSSHTVIK